MDDYPLIKPGTYSLKFLGWETRKTFNTAKVVMLFQVVDYGEAFGVVIARHYNAKRLKGKVGRKGGFAVGKAHHLARELFTVFEMAGHSTAGVRLDRIPLHWLEAHTIRGKVETVTHDSSREPIPKSLQYSVVGKLVGVVS